METSPLRASPLPDPGSPSPLHGPEVFDFDIGVPISALVTPSGRVQPGELPAARVARAVYSGSYEAAGGLGRIRCLAHCSKPAHRPQFMEVYLTGPESGAIRRLAYRAQQAAGIIQPQIAARAAGETFSSALSP